MSTIRGTLRGVSAIVLSCSALAASSCGGAGGSGTGDTLKGVTLVSFVQAQEDNVPLNRSLEFIFSSPIDPDSIGPAAIQIREGPAYGLQVEGRFIITGNRVFFEPHLPSLCDLSDAAFHPDRDYRVT